MPILAAALSLFLLLGVLWDAFETVLLPRRASSGTRLTRLFYKATWRPYRAAAQRLSGKSRESFLAFFGPLSMILLLAVWALGLILSFAGFQWAAGSRMDDQSHARATAFTTDLYASGTTFFTLGLGDVIPRSRPARILTVVEAGLGFGFLAMVIGYLPVLYGAFSRREVAISMMDARAGSPPSALELLKRHGQRESEADLVQLLRGWELWTAELMESHLSYPVLCYYRSQHDNQSWISALTTILDTCALILAGVEAPTVRQAKLTFAMARHAAVDLAQVFRVAPKPTPDRVSAGDLEQIRLHLTGAEVPLCPAAETSVKLTELRRMYEPHVNALAEYLLMTMPQFVSASTPDNWRTSTWERTASGRPPGDEEHR